MNKLVFTLTALLLGAILFATDADAKRIGGGRSVGAQRNVTAPPAATPAKPAQQQAQPAPAQQGSKWGMLGGILGGLALGGLLAWALSGTGMSTLLLIAMLAIVAFLTFRAFGRRREAPAMEHVHFAGVGNDRVALPAGGASAPAPQPLAVPAGFDAATFLRAAKLNFVKLQIANDSGKLDEIRDFTTDEMFAELRKDVLTRSDTQQTDVVSLNADLLEVATEQDNHWASVRFSGMVRETPQAAPVGFEEVWNLVKPAQGASGWLLAGIQQMH
ncbi:MAG TPA: Tim44-like domain-containing protein [Burkholderiales bacterium]|nr:Tim44-like domain-containing protein [Burkholderiales bacterium]